MAQPITLPRPPARTAGTLLGAAVKQDFPGPWALYGVTWNPTDFTPPAGAASGCDTVYEKVVRGELLAPVTQPAFLLWDSKACGALSGVRDLLEDGIRYTLEELRTFAFARELESAQFSGGLGLVGNATYVPARPAGNFGVPVAEAFGHLETYLASAMSGAVGMIHVTPAVYGQARALRLVSDDGRTATGHVVVGDAGHTGLRTPQGGNAGTVAESWAYATSTVFYDEVETKWMESPIDGHSQFDFSRNVDRPMAERYGILVFDPHVLAAVKVSIADTWLGS